MGLGSTRPPKQGQNASRNSLPGEPGLSVRRLPSAFGWGRPWGVNPPVLLHGPCAWVMGTSEPLLLGKVPRAENWRETESPLKAGWVGLGSRGPDQLSSG